MRLVKEQKYTNKTQEPMMFSEQRVQGNETSLFSRKDGHSSTLSLPQPPFPPFGRQPADL